VLLVYRSTACTHVSLLLPLAVLVAGRPGGSAAQELHQSVMPDNISKHGKRL